MVFSFSLIFLCGFLKFFFVKKLAFLILIISFYIINIRWGSYKPGVGEEDEGCEDFFIFLFFEKRLNSHSKEKTKYNEQQTHKQQAEQ